MEIVTLPADEVRGLIGDYKATAQQLIEAQRELSATKDNLVGIDWIAAYWSVSEDTARDMIRVLSAGRKPAVDLKVLPYGPKIVRYRRSDIERITIDNLVSLRDMLSQKRANRKANS